MMLSVGRKRRRAIKRRAKKRKITKEVVSKQLSILVESVNRKNNYWYKIDIDIEPYCSNKSCCVDGSFDYNRHDHTVDLNRYKFISPSPFLISEESEIFSFRDVPSAAIVGHKVYKLIHNKVMFFDLDAPSSCSWSPLPSCPCITSLMRGSRPKLLIHKGRLYVLACNIVDAGGGASDSLFGLVFDPENDSWDTITTPVVDIHLQPSFSTVSIRAGILLMLPQPWILDAQSGRWTPPPSYCLNTDTGEWCLIHTAVDLHEILPSIICNLVVVEEESTIYWITYTGCIYAHNLDTDETRFGPIIGLEDTHFLDSLLHEAMQVSLLHVTGDLFCLLYQDPMSDSYTSDLHCLITQIFKLKSSIFMNVIGCFCAPASGICYVRNSFLMR